MSELGHEVPDLDARLARIDRKLQEIQADLVPGHESRPLEETAATPEAPDAPGPEAAAPADPPPPEPAPPSPPEPDDGQPRTEVRSYVEPPTPRAEPPEQAVAPAPPPPPPEQFESPAEPPEPWPAPPEPPPAEPPHPASGRRGRDGPLATLLQRTSPRPQVHDRLVRQVEELTDLHVSLLSSMHEAITGLQHALGQVPRISATELTLSAGPFATIEAVHAFEHALERLPGVREVTIRGYEGADRAVIDVELSSTNT